MTNDHIPEEHFYIPLVIQEIRRETNQLSSFIFRNDHGLSFQAGQFITFADNSGLQEIRRSYSILSSPVLKEPLTIAVKRMENGFFSRKLTDQMQLGDKLLSTGVAGFFVLPEDIKKHNSIFFFAAGSGIVPVLSLLKTVLHVYRDINVFLIYSNHSRETTAFYDELKQLEWQFPNHLRIQFIFSLSPELKRARLNREFLLEIISDWKADKTNSLFYTCGPENYMRLVIFLLLEEGFPKGNIKKEVFNAENRKRTIQLPADKNTYHVRLNIYGKQFDFPVHYPDSILKAAQRRKLELPYSCETGICGSCAAKCISGEVWLSNNEVLTDEDLKNRYTLTCTGHPQQGNVHLSIE